MSNLLKSTETVNYLIDEICENYSQIKIVMLEPLYLQLTCKLSYDSFDNVFFACIFSKQTSAVSVIRFPANCVECFSKDKKTLYLRDLQK